MTYSDGSGGNGPQPEGQYGQQGGYQPAPGYGPPAQGYQPGYPPAPGYQPGYPPAPGYGPPAGGIPSEVNISSILLFISGGFALLGGLLLLFLGTVSALAAILGIVFLAIGGGEIYTGVALRALKPWARVAALALAGIGAVLSLISIFRGAPTSIVGLALDAYIIYAMTRPNVIAAFPRSR